MTTTPRDLVTSSLRELGVISAGETAPAEEALYGLEALNALIDQWAAERLMIYKETRTTWTITSGTGTYSVAGITGVARPAFVSRVNYLDTADSVDTEEPLEKLTDAAWAALPQKALTALCPSAYYYDYAFPTANLTLWPIPTGTTLEGVIYSPRPVAKFSSLTDTLVLPPGYERMIVKNLAVEMAPSFERRATPELIAAAVESRGVVKRANSRLEMLDFAADMLIGSHGSSYNIETDR